MGSFPIPVIDTFQRLRIPEGMVVHEVNCYPPRIWRTEQVFHDVGVVSFDAICMETEERLQGYSISRLDEGLPKHWRALNSEMEILALLSMDADEYWEWSKNH